METAVEQRVYTVEEYLTFEETAELRHEFVDGHLVDMAGESIVANMIALNLAVFFKATLRGQPYITLTHEVKLKVNEKRRYRYPDLMVVPATARRETHMVTEAVLVAEITSESTIETDTHSKLLEYSSLPSVQCYLIIAQTEPLVEAYIRRGDAWEYKPFRAVTDSVTIPALNLTLALTDLYEGIFQ
ncbi:Uma2 family endonuclease [Fibrella sp. HMF5335]|uniref:Uma2 family endonuclease n=1 Tax=Fibrella rubiginis TaxID=2817060 RepID=A0A939GHL4_9BACT|nr:Uma2 family endonuclease [Fibrella rubiginis]MBO0937349.1 Uma2 family endonuclease [Fibrella rubiginis]